MGLIHTYLGMLLNQWWAIVGLLVFGGLFELVGILSPTAKSNLERRFPAHQRRPLLLWLMFFAFAYAGFAAFSSEHSARKLAEQRARLAEGTVRTLAQRLATARSKPISTQPARAAPGPTLSRNLKFEMSGLTFAHFDANGRTSVSASEIAASSLTGLEFRLENLGQDTLRWKVLRVNTKIAGASLAGVVGGKEDFLNAGERTTVLIPFDRTVPLNPAITSAELIVAMEYDTVPSSGRRTSVRAGPAILEWIDPQPHNNTVPVPGRTVFKMRDNREI